MHRRDLIKSSLSLFATGLLSRGSTSFASGPKLKKNIIACSSNVGMYENYIVFINPIDFSLEAHKSPVFIHDILWSNKFPDTIITCSQWKNGPVGRLGIFSIKKKKFTKLISPPLQGDFFTGHGFISQNDFLYASYMREQKTPGYDSNGWVAVFDIKNNYKLVNTFKSFGNEPHQILEIDNGNRIALLNSGVNFAGGILTNSSYVELNTKDLSLNKKLTYTDSLQSNFGHMIMQNDSQLLIAGGKSATKVNYIGDYSSTVFVHKINDDKISTLPISSVKGYTFIISNNSELIGTNFILPFGQKEESVLVKNVKTNKEIFVPSHGGRNSTIISNNTNLYFLLLNELMIVKSDLSFKRYSYKSLPGGFGPHATNIYV